MISFAEALSLIRNGIQEIHYPEQPVKLYQPIAYLLDLKGKKIRPALTLLACNLYKEDVAESLNAALAWEIFHNFTLMHDDVMDNADVRRGQPAVHKKWDENTAILSGDAMFLYAFRYIFKYSGEKLPQLLDLFSTTTMEIFEGQEYDISFESRMDVSEKEYLNMIRLKTAVMIGACLKTGAIIGQATPSDQQLLYDFGINLGIAFQIQDDILDVYGNSATFGKNIGGDILCNKKTFLLISALNTAQGAEKEELLRWINVPDSPEKKIQAVTNLYNGLKIKDIARNKMEEFYQTACVTLNNVNVANDKKVVLKTLAEELMDRKT
ncbi:polyprenyl synthetase family protein [Bacteroidales bacterium OttesenSCG-928-M06]|nr:polyprenyl synthetase family protein [Bacteroidales bacterium OttesenSCG-928-M06]